MVVNRAGGVVGRADVDQIGLYILVRQRQKAVFGIRVAIDDLPARHDVDVHIGGIDRIGDEHGIVLSEQIEQIAQVALCAVADEDFINRKCHAVLGVIAGDGLTQEGIALFGGNVAVEAAGRAHLQGGFLHGFGHGWAEWPGYISDSQADDALVRM